ncbi:hypothetical protein JI664_15765 [Rhodobacter sp. NTK016B]|uniref:hypothetical protein n=1 Tax=Rhodobacter sp. NTK016B TaxID=2759676 RepID=UPI001A8D8357|nr:hypothetical protein [Rhodobacter sp. NTK016B]MBN8293430.1 hypothetical protein [Rhodobacter sp. NTK016B]
MSEDLLREISEEYLLPFFSGASIDSVSDESSASEATVAFLNPQTIGFKVNKSDTYRLKFRRDQPFAKKTDPAREVRVVEAFASILAEMNDELKGHLKEDLLSTFQRRVVARAVSDASVEKQVLIVLDQMSSWAARLYEGSPISSAVGIDPAAIGDREVDIEAFASNDIGAVLSNGHSSLLTFDSRLGFVEHLTLNSGGISAKAAPWEQAQFADWTAHGDGRVAVALNAHGEILVFRDGQLLFSKRNGSWHFLTHSPVLSQMAVPRNPKIREAIYETVLDASFGRRGACVGVVGSGRSEEWQAMASDDDRLELKASKKSKAISRIIQGRKFQDLDRTLRQELVSIDGATVIDHTGSVLAVGAIVRIRKSVEGGGRTAAAEALAKVGLGIKISQDGSIIGFRPETGKISSSSAAFRLM